VRLKLLQQKPNPMRVAICIGTFKRPELLRELLTGISLLTFCREPAPQIEIIVVDNDPQRTAQPVCSFTQLHWPLKYFVEEGRGITHVRNRAVAEAGAVDFIAFLDDDEVPTPHWLDELLSAQRRFRADVVTGPVLPKFAPDAPQWASASRLFHRPSFSTGQSLEICSTNNVLVRSEVFLRVPAFDDRFNLSGGEDTHFFLRVRKAGNSMIWSQQAIVVESIPAERANFAWLLRRGYQAGNSWSFCELSLDHRFRVRALRFLKGSGHVLKGLAATGVSLLAGKAALARSLQTVCLGLGMLTGLAGYKFLAYQFPSIGLATKPTDCPEHVKV
jgi:succinoglycan biosynthesis protein ExoM